MRAVCVREFRDFEAGRVLRRVGEEFECSPERLERLSSTKYGTLAEAAPEPPQTPAAPRKAASRAKGAPTRKRAPKSAQRAAEE